MVAWFSVPLSLTLSPQSRTERVHAARGERGLRAAPFGVFAPERGPKSGSRNRGHQFSLCHGWGPKSGPIFALFLHVSVGVCEICKSKSRLLGYIWLA